MHTHHALGCIASLTGETGTYQYMSPEMVRHEGYDCKTDVYSWGVMLVELVLQRSPFESLYLTPVQVGGVGCWEVLVCGVRESCVGQVVVS